MRAVVLVLAPLWLAQVEPRAIVLEPTQRDIERALKLAQAPEGQRTAFHAPYIMRPNHPLVEQIEVITEYRRYVLLTEEQLRFGNWMFSQSPDRAQAKVAPFRGRVSITARLRFHPQNTLIGVPPYEIVAGDPPFEPLDLTRSPINALLSGNRRDQHAPLVGAVVDAAFNAASIGQAARPVILVLRGEMVTSTTIDFSRLQ